ncbi:MAG: hypothetical protein KME05_14795 [Gloeocapsa sp. UFS-A4-WI-NPMV-4B04]|jgi:hypothetical protein|nr:hypothetical protein [Gloeocapsa sp. UFS-A4-WI-NPMV-4B04]
MMLRLSASTTTFYQTQVFEINGAAQQIIGSKAEPRAFIVGKLRVFALRPASLNSIVMLP